MVRKLFSVHHSYHYGDTSYTGVATYADTNIVWEENGSLHFRCQPHREYNLDTLTADVSISLNKRFPLLPDSASPLPLPLPDNTFVKAPTAVVSSVAELKSVAQGFLAELQLLETTLRSQPHPRISKYLGYVSEDGERVTGLVFEKYEENVWDARSRVGDNFDGAKIVAGVRKALQHLHSLGLVHCDICPRNIMLDKNGNVFLIDFGSCGKEGELRGGGTPGFTLELVEHQRATPEVDWFSLKLVEQWLVDRRVPGFGSFA